MWVTDAKHFCADGQKYNYHVVFVDTPIGTQCDELESIFVDALDPQILTLLSVCCPPLRRLQGES